MCFVASHFHRMKSIFLETPEGYGFCGGSVLLVFGIVCVPVLVAPSLGSSFCVVLGQLAVRGCWLVRGGLFHCLHVGCLVGMFFPLR